MESASSNAARCWRFGKRGSFEGESLFAHRKPASSDETRGRFDENFDSYEWTRPWYDGARLDPREPLPRSAERDGFLVNREPRRDVRDSGSTNGCSRRVKRGRIPSRTSSSFIGTRGRSIPTRGSSRETRTGARATRLSSSAEKTSSIANPGAPRMQRRLPGPTMRCVGSDFVCAWLMFLDRFPSPTGPTPARARTPKKSECPRSISGSASRFPPSLCLLCRHSRPELDIAMSIFSRASGLRRRRLPPTSGARGEVGHRSRSISFFSLHPSSGLSRAGGCFSGEKRRGRREAQDRLPYWSHTGAGQNREGKCNLASISSLSSSPSRSRAAKVSRKVGAYVCLSLELRAWRRRSDRAAALWFVMPRARRAALLGLVLVLGGLGAPSACGGITSPPALTRADGGEPGDVGADSGPGADSALGSSSSGGGDSGASSGSTASDGSGCAASCAFCQAGRCIDTILPSGVVEDIAVDTTRLYWTGGSQRSAVSSMPLAGGPVTALATSGGSRVSSPSVKPQ